MKKSVVAAFVAFSFLGQVHAASLDTDEKRLSYMLGSEVAKQIKSQPVKFDEAAFMAGLRDMMAGKASQLSQEDIQMTLQNMQKKQMEAAQKLAKENKKEGEEYLASNAKKKGVKTTSSGLQYKVIKSGSGKTPGSTDMVKVNYRGTLIDGTEFDSSYKRGQPAEFPVNGVIQGWQEVLQMMKEGDKWEIALPADIAYGARGSGPMIGPESTLLFEIELLEVK